jgi:hypothetical protein
VGGQQEAAQVLAAAVIAKDGVGLTTQQSKAVLSGLSSQGYLTISSPSNGSPTALSAATMAVVVAPSSPPSNNNNSPANQALIAVAEQFQAASHHTVLAGPVQGSGSGSVISDVVSGAARISTVDDADQPMGAIITVQALWQLLHGHAPASYGVGPGAVPSPAPSPSTSPSVSPSPGTSTRTSKAGKTSKTSSTGRTSSGGKTDLVEHARK